MEQSLRKKASSLDLKKLFPSSKFPTKEELKEKERSFSVGDRVKVSDHIRCLQKGHVGTIVRIDPEDESGWKSFIVKFDDKKYGSMGFSSGNIDKVVEKKASFLSFFKRSKPVAKAIVPSAGGRLAAAKNALRAEMSARLGMKRLSALIPEMEQIRERGLKGDAFVSAARELGISRVKPVVESTRDAIVRRLYEIAKRHSFDTDWKGTYSRVSRFGARTARDNPERVLEEVSRALRTESGRELGDNLRAAFEHGWKYTGSPRYDAGVDELLSWMPVKKASAKKETYESGEGEVESYTSDKTKDHDEIVLRLKDGRRIRISNNTRLGKRLGAKKGDRVNYNGYRVRGTDVVHKVHPNAHQRGGWLEAVPNRNYQIGKSAEDVQMSNEDFLKVSPARLKEKPAFKPSANGATLTPDLARANLYKEVYRQEKGDEYVPWQALDDARSDMEAAQRRRYEELLKHRVLTKDDYDLFTDRFIPGMRLPQEEFVPGRNYPVYPSKSDEVPKNSFMSKGYGSIYDSYPIMSRTARRSSMSSLNLEEGQGQNTSMNIATDDTRVGGPVVLHEGVHSFAHPSVHTFNGSSKTLGTSFWGKGGDFAPEAKGAGPWSGYASGQAERLVAVATEKARMHARGVDVTKPGVGIAWAEQALKDRGVQQTDPDRVNFDYYMNVHSLKSILYDLYDKANSPNATRADKIKYKQFLDTIDRDFQLVDNKGTSNYTPYETKTASVFDGLEAAVDAAIDRIIAN